MVMPGTGRAREPVVRQARAGARESLYGPLRESSRRARPGGILGSDSAMELVGDCRQLSGSAVGPSQSFRGRSRVGQLRR